MIFLKSKDKIKTAAQVLLLPQDSILPNPDQPRKRFDYDELEGLAQSIRQNGILQPVTVRRRTDGKNVKFELVAGERRLRAARLVGLTKIPAIETDADEKSSAVLSLIENLQRQDLNFFEEAEAVQRLVEKYSMSREEAADKLGRAQSTLSNKLRLLRLPEEMRYTIEKSGLIEQMLNRRKKKNPIKGIRDIRVFINTLNHAVEAIRRAGIDADAAKSETEEYVEYTVRIPKIEQIRISLPGDGEAV